MGCALARARSINNGRSYRARHTTVCVLLELIVQTRVLTIQLVDGLRPFVSTIAVIRMQMVYIQHIVC